MAFAAFTAVCSYGGIPSNNSYHAPILGRPLWSESPTTNVTSTNAAPDADGRLGNPMVTCYATADSYVAFGTNPDPTATVATTTTSARMLVPASAAGVPPTQVWVNRGDRFKWIAA